MCGNGVYGKEKFPLVWLGYHQRETTKCYVNQDVLETCIPPINAQRLGVENILCSWVIGQNTEVLENNFLDFLVLLVVSED